MTSEDTLVVWMDAVRSEPVETQASVTVQRLLAFVLAGLPPEQAAYVRRSFTLLARATQERGSGADSAAINVRARELRDLEDVSVVKTWSADPKRVART